MAKPSPTYAGDQNLMSLGSAIRRTRKEIGLSQEALALEADLDRSYVGGVERGEHNLTVVSLIKLSNSLQIKPSVILAKSGL